MGADGNQFQGLDMHSLIASPLTTVCEAQSVLAESTYKFIKEVGVEDEQDRVAQGRNSAFTFEREILGENGATTGREKVRINVPMLSIVAIPAMDTDNVDIAFDMEVKSTEKPKDINDKEGSVGENDKIRIGPFSAKVTISSYEKKTRSTDNSAKYSVGKLSDR